MHISFLFSSHTKNLRLHGYEYVVYLVLVSTTFNIVSHDSNKKLLNGKCLRLTLGVWFSLVNDLVYLQGIALEKVPLIFYIRVSVLG